MRLWRCALLVILLPICCQWAPGQNIHDVYPDKARYAPGDRVALLVSLEPSADGNPLHATLKATFWHLDQQVAEIAQPVTLSGPNPVEVRMLWNPPAQDYMGYLAVVRLLGSRGEELARSETAIDVSSQWNRFPRYGYLAHYSQQEGAEPDAWIAELNKFHINGLEYYDFQYQHSDPLAGTVEHPAPEWHDIAGRTVSRGVLDGFLAAARRHNMMSMAYNSSYSAYVDAFTDGSGVRLQWATWDAPTGPRTLRTAKGLDLPVGGGWVTPRLIYMNQNSSEWQHYLFGQMADLFRVYPFDGWHIDTFGTRGAYAYDGAYVNFIAGFRPFIDNARQALNKRIVLNTVNAMGQDETARSDADFVYSELWEDHETYASIMNTAAQVHTANPAVGLVFAAYLQRQEKNDPPVATKEFNAPGVLLADAAIFASGASHIELGDGSRMLSGEYFPADTRFAVTPDLRAALRHYYDFLTAYENVLRYEVFPADAAVTVDGQPSSPYGVPNTVWTIARRKGGKTVVHFINLLGSGDPHWRDVQANRPAPPLLSNLRVRIALDGDVTAAGWASPDTDGGRYHALPITRGNDRGQRYVEFVLPSLKYWDMVILDSHATAR
ncbi:MAG TPA: glycoside hydrolase family 66 protein [Acidobacteriaceae bacterium]|nr:glycoside hydrolase family 66 protein [Acidobacteriaceae bacterium]